MADSGDARQYTYHNMVEDTRSCGNGREISETRRRLPLAACLERKKGIERTRKSRRTER
jgi:hypothetical protein